MSLTMPTRELVGLLADVLPFASPDNDDTTWHRIVLRWDGHRLHAAAGDGLRLAWMSWGPGDNDGEQESLFDPYETPSASDTWELAILPENAKEVATKFKVAAKEGELPLTVTGSSERVTVERGAEAGGVALRSVTLARPWDHNAPVINEVIDGLAAATERTSNERRQVAYSGYSLADFCDPKKVRQRGPVVLTFGPTSTVVRIGRWFRGALLQAEVPRDAR